ncbi:MAG: DNA polymerase IV, partial [Candidatus Thermoplasmatota archaeon]|nr:DNA polymerase IV [Candidatus Thermoplasmatota archaeon]
ARGHIPEVAEEALSRLGGDGIQGRTITLKVRLTGFETFTRSRTLPAPTDDPAIVTEVACALFDEAPVDGHVRLLGVRISGLDRSGPRQATLQAWPADVLGEAELKDPRDRPVWRF